MTRAESAPPGKGQQLKPSGGDADGTPGTVSPAAEVPDGGTRGAGAILIYTIYSFRLLLPTAVVLSPVEGHRCPAHPTAPRHVCHAATTQPWTLPQPEGRRARCLKPFSACKRSKHLTAAVGC